MAAAPKTLAELAERAGIHVDDFHEFREDDIDSLTQELGINTTTRVRLRSQFRQLVAKQQVVSAQTKFDQFFDRVGGADSLAGLQKVPVSTLPVALSFLSGKPGAPSKDVVKRATTAAYAKADALLPDPHSLTRDEIASVNMYTQDGWPGPQRNLFGPLNAALRSEARTDVKIYWGYIRLLQHALFKLPKDESGTLFRGIKLNWPNAPSLAEYKDELVRKHTQKEEEIWWGFSSTSTSLSAVRTFLGEEGPRVIFTVDGGSSARDVRRYSGFQQEDERLLPCGTAFHIKSAEIFDGILMVSLRQTDDILIQGGAPAEEPPLHEAAPDPTALALAAVCELGFTPEVASVARAACGNDIQQAVNSLLQAQQAELATAVATAAATAEPEPEPVEPEPAPEPDPNLTKAWESDGWGPQPQPQPQPSRRAPGMAQSAPVVPPAPAAVASTRKRMTVNGMDVWYPKATARTVLKDVVSCCDRLKLQQGAVDYLSNGSAVKLIQVHGSLSGTKVRVLVPEAYPVELPIVMEPPGLTLTPPPGTNLLDVCKALQAEISSM